MQYCFSCDVLVNFFCTGNVKMIQERQLTMIWTHNCIYTSNEGLLRLDFGSILRMEIKNSMFPELFLSILIYVADVHYRHKLVLSLSFFIF